ncbi:MAG: hypothetical protein KAY24_03640 [Candidatus Eisenbacteria sp.]|nr:hypothetical protein [Candidatus Eisenbacteria bacterium]
MCRRICLVLLVGTLSLSGAGANDPVNLAGGALIMHHPPEVVMGGECNVQLPTVGDQNPRIDGLPGDLVTFYVIGAFAAPREFCGFQFGFGEFDPSIFTFMDWGSCAGVEFEDYLELASSGWPGPNEGTACVSTVGSWDGFIVPMYYFTGIAYAEGVIPLDADPTHDMAAFTNCESWMGLPELFEIHKDRLGALGIFTDGKPVEPELSIRWACCADEECQLLSAADCDALGGTWLCGLLSCTPDPCKVRACCLEGCQCQLMTELECRDAGGLHISRILSCDPNPCPQASDGPQGSPGLTGSSSNTRMSWGAIKVLYR